MQRGEGRRARGARALDPMSNATAPLFLGLHLPQAWDTPSSLRATLRARRPHPCTCRLMGGGQTCPLAWLVSEGDWAPR